MAIKGFSSGGRKETTVSNISTTKRFPIERADNEKVPPMTREERDVWDTDDPVPTPAVCPRYSFEGTDPTTRRTRSATREEAGDGGCDHTCSHGGVADARRPRSGACAAANWWSSRAPGAPAPICVPVSAWKHGPARRCWSRRPSTRRGSR